MAQDTEHGGAVSRRNFIASGAGVTGRPPWVRRRRKRRRKRRPCRRLDRATRATVTLVQLTVGDGAPPVLDRMPAFFREAAERGSDLVVFPEYVLGHNLTPKSDAAQRFFALAREHRINAVTGCVEAHGDKWATSAWVVDRQGTLVGRYLKSHPASGPAPHFWPPVGDSVAEAQGVLGSEFKVFTLDFGPVGILQCYDGYFPRPGAAPPTWAPKSSSGSTAATAWSRTPTASPRPTATGASRRQHHHGLQHRLRRPGCVAPAGGMTTRRADERLWPRVKRPATPPSPPSSISPSSAGNASTCAPCTSAAPRCTASSPATSPCGRTTLTSLGITPSAPPW